MGNSNVGCLSNEGLNHGELESGRKENTASEAEYKEKVTSDDVLKILTGDKMRAAQNARTYEKGTVKVSVF
ncbi:hypothetical protein SteCoe_9777 [Stentor coeruleus]|uniref:Uncharacterized protein n=1 Tax=Stentor coeruleus TaxID=5963 RepID=A0A1R2CGX4_9CILI|nr:hypothetical protein SteCoe_9777 [Stentor coeruleus]